MKDAANKRPDNSWKGPVFGALILVVGFVGYQEWNKGSEHDRMCSSLKKRFLAGVTDSSVSGAIERSVKAGNQRPMLDIAGDVAANQEIMRTLDAECPGWVKKQYD